jgi:hypothetical protein
MKSRFIMLVFLVGFFSVGVYLVSASPFAVSTRYSSNFPSQLLPGEGEDTFFIVHNVLPGGEDVNIEVELVSGSEIASLTGDTEYFIPFGGEVRVTIRIDMPKDAKSGEEYRVAVLFRTSVAEEEGDVQFSPSIEKSFPVFTKSPDGKIVEESSSAGGKVSFLFWLFFMVLVGY